MGDGTPKTLGEISLADAMQNGLVAEGEIYGATSTEDIGQIAEDSEKLVAVLSDCFGGTVFYVPHDAKENSQLIEAVGPDDASIVTDILGGMRIYVPKLDGLRRRCRNREIADMRQKGQAISNIARRFSLSARQIQSILQGQKISQAGEDSHNAQVV